MARGRFVGVPAFDKARQLRVPKGYLLLHVPDKDEQMALRDMLSAWEHDAVKQVEKGEQPREIVFYWDVAYQKRALSKVNLIWALLTLTTKIQNEGMPDGKKRRPIDQYNEDKRAEGVMPSFTIRIESKAIPWMREVGVTVLSATPIEGTDDVQAWCVKTLSQQNDEEAHRYIEFLFNRLAVMGIPPAKEPRMKDWWLTWMMDIDDHRVELHGDVLSKEQYRELHPLCEGCMAFIAGDGQGQLAHIKSVGAGGEEPQLCNGAEWLHLCAECHLGVIHAKGWEEFLSKHRHLQGKVTRALQQPATGVAAAVKQVVRKGGVATIEASREDAEVIQQELFGEGEGKPPWAGLDPDDPRHPIV